MPGQDCRSSKHKENNMFNFPMDMPNRNSVVIDGIPSQTSLNPLMESKSFDVNNQNYAMGGYPALSTFQGDARVFDSNAFVTWLGRNVSRDASLGSSRLVENIEFQDQVMGGAPISSDNSLATFLAARSDIHENLNKLAISAPSIYPLEPFRTYASNDCPNDLNSSLAISENCGYNEVLGNINNKWDFEKFHVPPQFGGEIPERTRFQSYSSVGNLNRSAWISPNAANVSTDYPYGLSKYSNELSLSLATSQPPVISVTNISDQCLEIRCSGTTSCSLNATTLCSEQTSCSSKELSLSFRSNGPGQFSQLILGSRYLHAVQEILAQIANYSLENLDRTSYSIGGVGIGTNIPFSFGCPARRGMPPGDSSEFPDVDSSFEIQMEPAFQRRAVEAKKAQLLTLLQVVDEQYNQCSDEIHTVISAFHAATELDPQVHARFALQTISFLYKNLRERISNLILAMGSHLDSRCTHGKGKSLENSFIQEQWALQQLKRKNHQLWRPQRGLPERSVSVLRAWMFQNFLHPYPKDAEKHLLAVKSGLTRSQVSNWFINARVRLWKPMIEEMYAETNRRKAWRNEEGTESNHRSQISIINQRFNI